MEGNINDIIEALRLYENTQKLQTGSED